LINGEEINTEIKKMEGVLDKLRKLEVLIQGKIKFADDYK